MSYVSYVRALPSTWFRLVGASIVSLGMLIGGHVPVHAMDNDERPDLKVELIDVPIPIGQTEVRFRITNQSVWWANETIAHVQTVSPNADNVFDMLSPGPSRVRCVELEAPDQPSLWEGC